MSLIQPQSDYFSQCEEEEEEKAIMPPKQVYERANSEALQTPDGISHDIIQKSNSQVVPQGPEFSDET